MTPIDVRTVDKVLDPLTRAKSAHHAIVALLADLDQLSAIRKDAIEECLKDGMSTSELAAALKLSRSRISQLRVSSLKTHKRLFRRIRTSPLP